MRPRNDGVQLMIRLPRDLKAWLEERARRNCSTQASEIVRALRDRQDAEQRAIG
jgi:predicted transcriptional regulator